MSVLNYDKNLKPMVTVVCITYGHEEYIRQALDSFLMQKTDFFYQIFVGEDKGPDSTADIVREYAEKYPDKIVAFLREENMGAQRNLIDLCQKANSPYIAFCEGDDYWTDEYKLQKQFDLMEAHPEYRACVHATEILAEDNWYLRDEYNINEDGKIILPYSKRGFDGSLTELTAEEYIKTTPAHTSSYFYRWNYNLEIPEWYYKHFAGDHSLMMLQTGMGRIGIIPDVMSIYRRSEVGVYYYSDRTTHYFNVGYSWTKLLMDIREYFDKHYYGYCHEVITNRIENGAALYFRMVDELERYDDLLKHFDEEEDVTVEMLKIVIRRANMYKNFMKYSNSIKRKEQVLESGKEKWRAKKRMADYKKFAGVKKDVHIWVFSSKNGFAGDARFLYEYVVAMHPEINAVWIAEDKKEADFFIAENLPVVQKTKACSRKLLKKAAIFVTDSMDSDVFKKRGFNANTKVVRLNSPDLLELEHNDTTSVYSANKSENSSEYYTDAFMVVTSSQEAVRYMAQKYELPEERFFVSALPRIEAVVDYLPKGKKVLYVPEDYTQVVWENAEKELLLHLKKIEQVAEKEKFEFYYWSKFSSDNTKTLKTVMKSHQHIHLLEGDIHASLKQFDVLISGISSLVYDFLTFDKPVIIISKNKAFFEKMKKYSFDINNLLPGLSCVNLSQALSCLVDLNNGIDCMEEQKMAIMERLYDYDITKENNTERIFKEIIRRLE